MISVTVHAPLKLSGFHLLEGAGGKLPPQTLQLPPKNFKLLQSLCVYNNSSNDKILALFCALVNDTQKWAYR